MFLTLCFILVITAYSIKVVSLTTLIQLPNTTLILTYLGGCAAGLVLLKESRLQYALSLIALILTVTVLVFTGMAILYPLVVIIFLMVYKILNKK